MSGSPPVAPTFVAPHSRLWMELQRQELEEPRLWSRNKSRLSLRRDAPSDAKCPSPRSARAAPEYSPPAALVPDGEDASGGGTAGKHVAADAALALLRGAGVELGSTLPLSCSVAPASHASAAPDTVQAWQDSSADAATATSGERMETSPVPSGTATASASADSTSPLVPALTVRHSPMLEDELAAQLCLQRAVSGVEQVLDCLMRADTTMLFHHPVSDDVAPGYSAIIRRPMDLSTVRRKLHAGEYAAAVQPGATAAPQLAAFGDSALPPAAEAAVLAGDIDHAVQSVGAPAVWHFIGTGSRGWQAGLDRMGHPCPPLALSSVSRDLSQIWRNALVYNAPGSLPYEEALRLCVVASDLMRQLRESASASLSSTRARMLQPPTVTADDVHELLGDACPAKPTSPALDARTGAGDAARAPGAGAAAVHSNASSVAAHHHRRPTPKSKHGDARGLSRSSSAAAVLRATPPALPPIPAASHAPHSRRLPRHAKQDVRSRGAIQAAASAVSAASAVPVSTSGSAVSAATPAAHGARRHHRGAAPHAGNAALAEQQAEWDNNEAYVQGPWRKQPQRLCAFDVVHEYCITPGLPASEAERLLSKLSSSKRACLCPAGCPCQTAPAPFSLAHERFASACPCLARRVVCSSARGGRHGLLPTCVTARLPPPPAAAIASPDADAGSVVAIALQDAVDAVVLAHSAKTPSTARPSRFTPLQAVDVQLRHVWGIDSYTRRSVQLSLADVGAVSEEECRAFVERQLLPALQRQPAESAHDMRVVLRELVQRGDERTAKLARAVLGRIKSMGPNHFRVHPKGLGVVCVRSAGVPAHAVVADYAGEVAPPWRWLERQAAAKHAHRTLRVRQRLPDYYSIALERHADDAAGFDVLFVDPVVRGNFASRLSHCCAPNCAAVTVVRDGQFRVLLYTLRDVACGEELTFDYGASSDDFEEVCGAVCLCGAATCRGSMLLYTAADHLQHVLRQHHSVAHRSATLLRACDPGACPPSGALLQRVGIAASLLHGLPAWSVRYLCSVLQFVQRERGLLADELREAIAASGAGAEAARVQAEADAHGVLSMRLQSVAIAADCVRYVWERVAAQRNELEVPVLPLGDVQVAQLLWNGDASLVQRMLKAGQAALARIAFPPHLEGRLGGVEARVAAAEAGTEQGTVWSRLQRFALTPARDAAHARTLLRCVRDVLAALASTCAPRLLPVVDCLTLHLHTRLFFAPTVYPVVVSPPVHVRRAEVGEALPSVQESEVFLAAANARGAAVGSTASLRSGWPAAATAAGPTGTAPSTAAGAALPVSSIAPSAATIVSAAPAAAPPAAPAVPAPPVGSVQPVAPAVSVDPAPLAAPTASAAPAVPPAATMAPAEPALSEALPVCQPQTKWVDFDAEALELLHALPDSTAAPASPRPAAMKRRRSLSADALLCGSFAEEDAGPLAALLAPLSPTAMSLDAEPGAWPWPLPVADSLEDELAPRPRPLLAATSEHKLALTQAQQQAGCRARHAFAMTVQAPGGPLRLTVPFESPRTLYARHSRRMQALAPREGDVPVPSPSSAPAKRMRHSGPDSAANPPPAASPAAEAAPAAMPDAGFGERLLRQASETVSTVEKKYPWFYLWRRCLWWHTPELEDQPSSFRCARLARAVWNAGYDFDAYCCLPAGRFAAC